MRQTLPQSPSKEPRIFLRFDALLLILVLAFVVRLSLTWHPGYGFDIGVYQGWARSAVELGMAESYTTQIGGNMLPDYPPLSIIMLTGFGHVYKLAVGEFDLHSLSYKMYIKMPAVLADLMICGLLYLILSRWKNRKIGVLGALAYALNPAAIYDSAIWGQTDAIYSMVLMAALVAWLYKKRDLTAILLACAILTKFQAIVLYPMFGLMVLLTSDRRQFLRFVLVGICTVLVVLIPFAIGGVLQPVVEVYTNSVGHYSNVTIGAYNFWWSILADKGWRIQSTTSPFGLLTYTQWGLVLFGSLYAFILWIFRRELKRSNPDALFYCAALLCAAFFLFLTQMHERYLFPFVAFGIPMMFMGKHIAAAYWIMVVAFVINLMGVMPLSIIDKGAFREFDSLDVFIASTQVWMFTYLLIHAYKKYKPKRRRVR